MVQSDFFDIIDEEEEFEPRSGLMTALILLSTGFMALGIVLAVMYKNAIGA